MLFITNEENVLYLTSRTIFALFFLPVKYLDRQMAWAKIGSGKSLPVKKNRMNIDILEELLIPAEKKGIFHKSRRKK